MLRYDIAFCVGAFFLAGVLIASVGFSFLTLLLSSVLAAAIFLFVAYFFQETRGSKFFWLTGLSFFVAVGGAYYLWDDLRFKNHEIIFDKKADFRGLVVSDPEVSQKSQKFIIELQTPYKGRALARLGRYPKFKYGDFLELRGIIKPPDNDRYANILAKDRVSGVVSFPKVIVVETNQGSFIKSALFKLKSKSLSILQSILPPQKAAFLAGITLGHRADFSKEFETAMNLSGTTHLVALSGYNVTVIVMAIGITLGYFLKRRWQFPLMALFVLGFVVMTGAEASIVRAAIMGIIVLIAHQAERTYSFRNAITFAALLMVLYNPKVLLFDLGFQLSFFALLGIVYLRPAIVSFFKISEESGFLSWRENALTTVAAQLAVVPLLLSGFGTFSLSSFIANILILSVVPVTMFLGFFAVFVGLFSMFLANWVGLLANLFLSYEIFLINIFSKLKFLLIQTQSFGIFLSLLYFAILAGFIFAVHKLKLSKNNLLSD